MFTENARLIFFSELAFAPVAAKLMQRSMFTDYVGLKSRISHQVTDLCRMVIKHICTCTKFLPCLANASRLTAFWNLKC